jgi:hypothetical protein
MLDQVTARRWRLDREGDRTHLRAWLKGRPANG